MRSEASRLTGLLMGPNFAAIEQSGQDQGRVNLPLGFLRELLITKEVFQSSERRCSRFDALEDVGVRGEQPLALAKATK